jgi:hypothetical protein
MRFLIKPGITFILIILLSCVSAPPPSAGLTSGNAGSSGIPDPEGIIELSTTIEPSRITGRINPKRFLQITLENEFDPSMLPVIKRWHQDMIIEVRGEAPDFLLEELDRILLELNALIQEPQLRLAKAGEGANFIIFFGGAREYAKIEPGSRFYTGTNFGLFYAYWNGSYEIYKGSMYVDLERTPTPEAKRHLLREELTQALGLMNDIQQEPESLFHGYWTETVEFSEEDRNRIRFLYHPQIQSGMSKDRVLRVLESIQPSP